MTNDIQLRRRHRKINDLVRGRLNKIYDTPSRNFQLLSPAGKTTRKDFLNKVFRLLNACMNHMQLKNLSLGTVTSEGLWMPTWAALADEAGLTVDQMKDARRYILDRGWLTSVQPIMARKVSEDDAEFYGLVSVKKFTKSFFKMVGLVSDLEAAQEAAAPYFKKHCNKAGIAIGVALCPITLLRKIRAKADAKKAGKKRREGAQPVDLKHYTPKPGSLEAQLIAPYSPG